MKASIRFKTVQKQFKTIASVYLGLSKFYDGSSSGK